MAKIISVKFLFVLRLLLPAIFSCCVVACDSLLPLATEPVAAVVKEPEAEEENPDSGLLKAGLERSGEVYTGRMSWYSVRTNRGAKTASGEKLDDEENTAAHRNLPFGTLVEVMNLANDEKVVLRINDRGPYIKGRELDVSIGAARKLGFEKTGVVPCRIEILKEIKPETEESQPRESEPNLPSLVLVNDSQTISGERIRETANGQDDTRMFLLPEG